MESKKHNKVLIITTTKEKSRLTDRENKLMITSEERAVVGVKEGGNKKYKQSCIKQISYKTWCKTQGIYTIFYSNCKWSMGFPGDSMVKTACNAGDAGDASLIPGSGRSPGGGHGKPLPYSCLENPMNRGTWQATVHGVTQSQTHTEAT